MDRGEITVTTETVGVHTYSVQEPQDMPQWLAAAAEQYVALRTECAIPLPNSLDLTSIGVLSTDALQKRLAAALVPKPDPHRGNFSVSRADLSEVAAYMILEEDYGTAIDYKLVRDRETIASPGRGIDVIGLEEGDRIVIVLTEVKYSDEDSQPKAPGVVDKSDDCMRNQHRRHLRERSVTSAKILDCARRSRDPGMRDLYVTAALYFEEGAWEQVGVVSCCVLVRPKARHCAGDFGSFRAKPDDYAPGAIRFIVVSLPGTLEEVLAAWGDAVEARRRPS